MSLALSTCVLFILILNATPLPLSSACLAAALSPAPVIVIFHLTRIYASL